MSDPAAQLALILGSLTRSQVVRYSNVASACLFMYDYVVTLPDEISLVWPAAWGPGKILFLLARYVTWPEITLAVYQQLSDIPATECHSFFTYFSWSTVWGIGVAEMILMLRTWALWNRKQSILIGLVTLFCAIWAPISYIISVVNAKTTFVASSSFSPALSGCFVTGSTSLISVAWILLTCFDFVILGLTIIKGLEHFKHQSSTLLSSLYRDGLLYFVYLFSIALANVIVLYTTPPEFTILLNNFQRVLHAMLSCRIILQLRALAVRSEVQTFGLSSGGRRQQQWSGTHSQTLSVTVAEDQTSAWFGEGYGTSTLGRRWKK
ncbi:hypothetical protein EXIGLDRAFT_750161 [Exidia glandulosa HHB12029]|uniref:DUF6533 domain-containing protein n=1 Tax=Exidia glandulosa HHB12029 TaxID=1314781 RepID=A0A165H449_EXIGL|nr:hypothetical protein EXIGLDRAFT_752878 [Exidia glandulosa HHB12029]KZV91426.1 hypothetical protein EXIGLDRAFT_750161 [Exidia glandulosa HHB12029]